MVIGLMLVGILSGLVSATIALVAGHSLAVALGAYALGALAASMATLTVLTVRTAFTAETPAECAGGLSHPGDGRT